ncbi:hypothetical protein ACEPPN_009500 [Leptodophora sp. 'Broadleaf-Isolate-01']
MGGGSVYNGGGGDDEEEGNIVDIEEIQAHGIGAADISKLKAQNIHTVATLLSTTTRRLLKIKGFSEIKVEKIKEAAKKLSPTAGFITAAELGQIRKRCVRISTGSKQLDAALNGQVKTRGPNNDLCTDLSQWLPNHEYQ